MAQPGASPTILWKQALSMGNDKIAFQLFNFDHGLNEPCIVEVGPYRIEVTAEDCERLTRLPRNDLIRFTHDSQARRITVREKGEKGEFLATARVTCDDPPGSSVLFPSRPEISSDYDLVLLLSFLTGRRVYLESEINGDPRRSYSTRVVSSDFIRMYSQNAWRNLGNLERAGLSDALYCIVNAPLAPELVGRGAYVNGAFDCLVTNWATQNQRTKHPNRPAIERGVVRLVACIDRMPLNKARAALVYYFKVEGVSEDVARDIRARLMDLGAAPSALMKITAYLKAQGLFPENPTEHEIKRLKRLNAVRNAITHAGTIRLEKGLGVEASDRIAGASILLIQDIVELGIARAMTLDDYLLQKTQTDIKEFFTTGAFRGQLVVDETYEEFLDRVAADWAADGSAP